MAATLCWHLVCPTVIAGCLGVCCKGGCSNAAGTASELLLLCVPCCTRLLKIRLSHIVKDFSILPQMWMQDAVVIGARFDVDAAGEACRLAFYGRLVGSLGDAQPQQLRKLQVYKVECTAHTAACTT
jgi:hypothetical protein